jgi:NAD(P)-dependent dehydrogenase (short-subunit alcohol dehydrogenase family)
MIVTKDTKVTLIGASRSIGRAMAERFHGLGAQVLVVARGRDALDALSRDLPGIGTLALDATKADAAAQVFARQEPDLLVICGGAPAPCLPFHEVSWEAFSTGWNTDMQISFNFLKEVIRRPLKDGTHVITVTSGAMLNGSPISGGYAGAKKMQMFLSNYAQREADRAGLKLRFQTIAPLRLIPNTGVGDTGIAGYAVYNGTTEADFLAGTGPLMSPETVADAVLAMLPDDVTGAHFGVAPDGLSPLI